MGWRISYRSSEPEKHDDVAAVAKLSRRHRLLGRGAVETIKPGMRHATPEQMQRQFEASRLKQARSSGDYRGRYTTAREGGEP